VRTFRFPTELKAVVLAFDFNIDSFLQATRLFVTIDGIDIDLGVFDGSGTVATMTSDDQDRKQ
jgi:hypothetical protein